MRILDNPGSRSGVLAQQHGRCAWTDVPIPPGGGILVMEDGRLPQVISWVAALAGLNPWEDMTGSDRPPNDPARWDLMTEIWRGGLGQPLRLPKTPKDRFLWAAAYDDDRDPSVRWANPRLGDGGIGLLTAVIWTFRGQAANPALDPQTRWLSWLMVSDAIACLGSPLQLAGEYQQSHGRYENMRANQI